MPNHVTTRCYVEGPRDSLERFKAFVFGTDEDSKIWFDFDRIIPMPEVVRHTESSSDADLGREILLRRPIQMELSPRSQSYLNYPFIRELGIKNYDELEAWAKKERPNAITAGQCSLDALEQTGFPNWYEWSINTWGTKWNAYGLSIESERPNYLEFRFDTAWSFPEPIFEKLAEKFPDLTISILCFDEGWNFEGFGMGAKGQFKIAYRDAKKETFEKVHGRPYVEEED